MAWDDGDNIQRGPWKKPDQPPDFEELLRKLREWFSKSGISGLVVIVIAVVGMTALSCFYTIQPGEVGVVQRFGKFVRMATPGLNWKMPAGIEKVTKVSEQFIYTEEFGIRTAQTGARTQFAAGSVFLDEALMLTGDLNTALVPWVVQYRIGDPYQFLFKVRNVRDTLRSQSEAVMRQVIGDRSVNEVLTERLEIANESRRLLQIAMNDAQTGLAIVNLELKKTTVPEPVQPSFNEVNQALQEKERLIYQAREAYNKVIPEAKGEAERMVKDAEGYALERVNMAQGDATRFLQLLAEYSKARDVTRRRLYLETMSTVIPRIGTKYILDPQQSSLLPLLDLGQKGGERK